MFEVRVLCRRLPKLVNDFGVSKIISLDISSSISANNNSINHKVMSKNDEQQIRDFDRQCLAKRLQTYELQIEENEKSYHNEWHRLFENDELLRPEENVRRIENFTNCLNNYLQHRMDTGLRRIRYKETIFRMKLNHPRRRGYSWQQQRSSLLSETNRTMNVYPEVIIEIPATDQKHLHRFTDKERALLSSAGMSPIWIVLCECTEADMDCFLQYFVLLAGGPDYIRSNQSFLYHKKKSQRQTQKDMKAITDKLRRYLHEEHGVPLNSLNMKQFSTSLEALFNERYVTCTLSYLDQHHMRNDEKLVHSIKRKLRKAACIIRVSDKSGVFHIGLKSDYEKKVSLYQQKTNAYVELSSNPLMETFYKVVQLLNDLRSKEQIRAWQHKEMMPKKEKIKLAYLYFIPKAHKVMDAVCMKPCFPGLHMYEFVHLGRYTTTTDCVVHRCTNDWHLQNVRPIDSTSIR